MIRQSVKKKLFMYVKKSTRTTPSIQFSILNFNMFGTEIAFSIEWLITERTDSTTQNQCRVVKNLSCPEYLDSHHYRLTTLLQHQILAIYFFNRMTFGV